MSDNDTDTARSSRINANNHKYVYKYVKAIMGTLCLTKTNFSQFHRSLCFGMLLK